MTPALSYLLERIFLGTRGLGFDLIGLSGGDPIPALTVLLESDHEIALETAAGVLAELGSSARVLERFLPKLMRTDNVFVEFYAIEFICSLDEPSLVAEILNQHGYPTDERLNFKWILQLSKCEHSFVSAVLEEVEHQKFPSDRPSLQRALFLANRMRQSIDPLADVLPLYEEETDTLKELQLLHNSLSAARNKSRR